MGEVRIVFKILTRKIHWIKIYRKTTLESLRNKVNMGSWIGLRGFVNEREWEKLGLFSKY